MKQFNINKAKHTTALSFLRMGMIAVMLFSGLRLSAQENVVTGTVRDATTQQPLLGVRVGTAKQSASAVTDADGSFSIKVASFSEVLLFSAPDYAMREIPLQGRQSVDVPLYSTLFASGYGTVESLSGVRRKTLSSLSENLVTDFSASTSFSIEPEITLAFTITTLLINKANANALAIHATQLKTPRNTLIFHILGLDSVIYNNQTPYRKSLRYRLPIFHAPQGI